MKSTRAAVILLSLLCALPVLSFAWGRDGHRIVAAIAMRYLTPAARQHVTNILDGTTPENAATWMDELRGNHAFDYMKPWHYINIKKGAAYKPGGNNIITALETAYADLENNTLSADTRKTDILILFHLVGDLHQPLHVGYGSDKGGNTVQVQFSDRGANLHHIWDDDIIEQGHITAEACMNSKNQAQKEISHVFRPSDFVVCMEESRALLEQVYDFRDHAIDEAYILKNAPIVKSQLFRAGVRLAAVLNSLLSNAQFSVPRTATKRVSADAADNKLAPEDAAMHLGEIITICGKVFGVKYAAQSKRAPTFINLGAAYPNSPCTAVIFGDDRKHFSYVPEAFLDGKTVCVKGKAKEYRGRPEIIVTDEAQIEVQP